MMRRLLCVWLFALPAAAAWPEVTVRQGSATLRLPLERYVAGVLGGEASVFQSAEALKAMAVSARTYAIRLRGRHAGEGFDFCASTHCQRVDLAAVTPRLEAAARETAGELLWFEGKPVFACYTRDCGGRTEDAAEVWPDLAARYLASRDDPWCVRGGGSPWQWTPDPLELAGALRRARLRTPAAVERVAIEQRTRSGRARLLVLTGGGQTVRISAGSFRFAVGRELGWNHLPGDRYEIRSAGGRPTFEGSGAGHGVGLCQRGAEQMGLAGRTWREILAFYYAGTEAGLTAAGLVWKRLGGSRVSLFTTRPEGDRAVLEQAERMLSELSARAGLPAPPGIEIRLYPDLDSFRNATGEPGWVAAHTQGRRIHLQPAAELRGRGAWESTLRHELAHAVVEAHAAPGLPAWFREGLAGVLAEPGAGAGAVPHRIPSDSDLRQKADAARARRAYEDATRAVAALVARHGWPAVAGWLKTGLPAGLTASPRSGR
jgi:stage II sporulation protein D